MEKQIILTLTTNFEECANEQNGVEFWYARDLQKLLEYTDWRNFLKVVNKAQESCKNADSIVSEHFVDINKMIEIGKTAERKIEDIMLTRYACYLIAQNADPQKETVAFAQTYFAVQTRKQEIIQERILLEERLKARKKLNQSETELSKNIFERGVNEKGFARIRSKGDTVLFGGNSTQDMKQKMNVPIKRPLADFLPTITITAKNLATEITNFNVKNDDLYGEKLITDEHSKNNQDVRNLLLKNNIIPENLPAAEDIKKLQRRINTQTKKSLGESKKLE
ncbi:MAG: DNA damage-inducible protein D [Bacteroidetes bacterium]|nr:MAG: DNA damage-inducible protein D [Bacteroidota bacterium]TAG88418.1 MAG: DNA damage-inducible protein D [Bacteroidota bacterium]